ncbi:ABC transporter permease [Aquicoccus porphyridii]|uniref:ABC transporter permease n=1 Tax=Aquicoccus porphyridii TaxID=1852029 RepID=A0A5A9YYT4_9RHOB|nr:ABC transporter permease [Aquicoccus porphyridii]KAA0910018.1 ABC transporter permease [Aquicoccus porphyridii]RAI52114.1 ABC transporter permease [Rhodobacteraceae bacterium AsT-22]
MLTFLLGRIFLTIPVMAVVSLVVFSLLYLTPGDPAQLIAGEMATENDIAALREQLGLDQPFFVRFATWVAHVLSGDLGTSIYSQLPVGTVIAQRLGATLWLACATVIISTALAVPAGVAAAYWRGSRMDRIIMAMSTLGFSVPIFVVGYLLIFAFSVKLKWFPVQGFVPPGENLLGFVRSITLPALSLSLVFVALIARITRASMIEVMSGDFVRTARAKGLRPSRIVWVHSLRNASLPIVTTIGVGIANLLGGVVVTESVFGIPGLGRLLVESVLSRDYPMVQALILLFALAYVLINLITDILYMLIDPRLRT